jgi:hypothetical protein
VIGVFEVETSSSFVCISGVFCRGGDNDKFFASAHCAIDDETEQLMLIISFELSGEICKHS